MPLHMQALYPAPSNNLPGCSYILRHVTAEKDRLTDCLTARVWLQAGYQTALKPSQCHMKKSLRNATIGIEHSFILVAYSWF